jgi:hypothetical protein
MQTPAQYRVPGNGFFVNPTAVYSDGDLVLGLDLTHETLSKARRAGRLKYVRVGKRVLYLGAWLLAWLEQGEREAALAR